MANSLRAKLSKLRYDGHITDAEYQAFIKKMDGHDREIRAKAIDEFASELENHSIYADIGKGDEVKMEWVSPVTRIKEVAEQMKEVRNDY